MKTRLLIIIGFVMSCFFFIPPVFAEMTFSEFQIFCSEKESQNCELLSTEQRQRFLLCNYSDTLSEKYYDWIGIERDWKNFAEQVSLEYAQTIPQYSKAGIADSLIVNAFVSGRESFPPPMGARISFYYFDDGETKRFFEVYQTNLLGDFEKIRDYRTPTLKLFKTGYDIDQIECKENLFLIQKHDGSPACVTLQTKEKLLERGWMTISSDFETQREIAKEIFKSLRTGEHTPYTSFGLSDDRKSLDLYFDKTVFTIEKNEAYYQEFIDKAFAKVAIPINIIFVEGQDNGDE